MSKSSKNNDLIYSLKITLLMAPLLAVPLSMATSENWILPFIAVPIWGIIYGLKNLLIYFRLAGRKFDFRESLAISLASLIPFMSSLGLLSAIAYIDHPTLVWVPLFLILFTYNIWIYVPIKYLAGKRRKNILRIMLSAPYPTLKNIVFAIVMLATSLVPVVGYLWDGGAYDHPLYVTSGLALAHILINTLVVYTVSKYSKPQPKTNPKNKVGLIFKIITYISTVGGVGFLIFSVIFYISLAIAFSGW